MKFKSLTSMDEKLTDAYRKLSRAMDCDGDYMDIVHNYDEVIPEVMELISKTKKELKYVYLNDN